jgi:hypothetical protein
MSRWLKSVNTLLENLDGTAENVAERGGGGTVAAATAAATAAAVSSEHDDDESDDDDEHPPSQEEPSSSSPSLPPPSPTTATKGQRPSADSVSELSFSEAYEEEEEEEGDTASPGQPKSEGPIIKIEPQSHHHPGLESSADSSLGAVDPPRPPVRKSSSDTHKIAKATSKVMSKQHPRASDAATTALPQNNETNQQPPQTSTTNININAAYAVATAKLHSLQQQLEKVQTELEDTRTKNRTLQQTLAQSEQEIEAQAKELQRAGQEMENIRKTAKEEQEDILEDHEDELEELQREHQTRMDRMRQDYETTIAQWKEHLEREQAKRQQEGGNWNQELEDAVHRERDALQKLHQATVENDRLTSTLEKLTGHSADLQTRLDAAVDASKAAAARERQAQDELDISKASHSRQLWKRQRREAELEQTVAELGSALSMAKRQHQQSNTESADASKTPNSAVVNYKERWEQATEELETLRIQLNMETQRRQALEQELQEIAQERTAEAALAQTQRAQSDRKISELEASVARLQAALRCQQQQVSNNGAQKPTESARLSEQQHSKMLDEAKQEISKLSDQLLRHQRTAETAKSEISALKGRLQSAVARADEAERAAFQTSTASHDVESGNRSVAFASRRRIKGSSGARGGGRTGVRSIRSALRLGSGPSSSPATNQLLHTIDAMDGWMVDTGAFMRTEPFARLGFLLYLVILHTWSFALVLFHTVEVEHGDFGSMDSNPRHWRAH